MIGKLLRLTTATGRRQLIGLITTVVITAVLQGVAFVVLVPFLTSWIAGDAATAAGWLITLVVIALVYGVVFRIGSLLGQRAATEVLQSLLDRLGDRLVELPLGWYATDRSGTAADIATRGVVFASTVPYAILRPILTAFITPATVLVGALLIDWRIGLTLALAVPLIWLCYRWISRRMAAADRDHAAAVGDASARVIEYARVQPALRGVGDNAIARRLVADALRDQHAANRALMITGGTGVGVFGAVVQLTVIAVLIVGSYLALGGDLGLGSLVALLVLAVRFTEPVVHSGALGGGVAIASNTLDRIQGLLDEPALPEPTTPARPSDSAIRFDRVSFGYGDQPVLRELSFEVPAGSTTAIVGPSGSGKTTIIRLIARFYDPDRGTVAIGGAALPDLGSRQVAAMVAPVFQDVYLFDATIIDNIRIGDPAASEEDVLDAARRARVDEIADRLPGGWQARVGEGGSNLSGGERQRVSIARALLKRAPIVLLDEATAALDVTNEAAITDAVTAVRDGRTVVVVAHRLQTIAGADQILLLDESGTVAERGTHAELLAAGGRYARYWNERVDAAGWRLIPQP
ncbi:ABC transporter ATP-binding protein [Microlunatus parietis]|uniref:ATP-binding cassette subfamily B protein n=1 Tax=Microlunatus parietis TaxID=682979 RepID=A0A7Y9I436_9ACTN|nr:ABC transporter ATP-binding protein [Microlunatus parietis]NYE69807.1 ATP-binding cassette subfamily B protein [Microlunatus parietis]